MESLGFLKQQLGLSMAINPEMLAAREMFNILKLPSAVKIETFSNRNFEIIELILREGSALTGVRLMDLRNKYKAKFLICVVRRGEKVYIPDGNVILQPGDKIGLTAEPSEIQKFRRQPYCFLFGQNAHTVGQRRENHRDQSGKVSDPFGCLTEGDGYSR